MSAPTAKTPDTLGAKILIVDDQPLNVVLLQHLLGNAGYRALKSAGSGSEVVPLHREHVFDLILLDVEMPGMDGYAVMQALWAIETESYLPVIAVTANPEHKLKALRAGARDFITKPFELAEVLMRVSNFLEVRMLHLQARERSKQLESLALTDDLTGLANRRLLDDRVAKAVAQCQRQDNLMAVLYLDLDGFKAVNDRLGHAAGDALLQEIARRLLQTVRGIDTVSRLGGDEFVVALCQLHGADDARVGASKVLRAIVEPVRLGEESVTVTASIGVSLYPEDGQDIETLMQSADAAMYEAKRAGKNQVRFATAVRPALADAPQRRLRS